MKHPIKVFFATLGPGILVAATGVGAGDLATASFAGNVLGIAILWAVIVGAFMKFVLNEGLARWQLATGETLLEGCMARFGRPFHVLFALYFFSWSFFVSSALMSACGVTLHAMIPLFESAQHGRIFFGALSSLAGVVLVYFGGYRLFERVMGVCIAIMFVVVVVTAAKIGHDWGAIFSGMVTPSIPRGPGLNWALALIGGVGGTLTVLCYGYWIREEGRKGTEAIRACRIDLSVGYAMTAIFGIAMVIIGSDIAIEGKGTDLIVALAERLEGPMGTVGKWAFLVGALGAVFSSLLGVWQSIPYLFADFLGMVRGKISAERTQQTLAGSKPYNIYLVAIAVVPLLNMFVSFKEVQKTYAMIGALFMPFLAFALLYLNGTKKWVGSEYRNSAVTNLVLVAILVFFSALIWLGIAAS